MVKILVMSLKLMHKSKKKCNFVCILKIMCNFAKSFQRVFMRFLENVRGLPVCEHL